MAEGCVHASEGIRSGAAVAGGRRLEFPASAEKGESGQAGEVLRDQERAEPRFVNSEKIHYRQLRSTLAAPQS